MASPGEDCLFQSLFPLSLWDWDLLCPPDHSGEPATQGHCSGRDRGAEGDMSCWFSRDLWAQRCPGKEMGPGTGLDAILATPRRLWRPLIPRTGKMKSLGWVQQPGGQPALASALSSHLAQPGSAEGMVLQAE